MRQVFVQPGYVRIKGSENTVGLSRKGVVSMRHEVGRHLKFTSLPRGISFCLGMIRKNYQGEWFIVIW